VSRREPTDRPLPAGFLDWQVKLRRHTMQERHGAPHVGVAPLLTTRRPGAALGVATHSIICGLLAAPERLAESTKEFRALYEESIAAGARAVYDRGIGLMQRYYRDPSAFDAASLTTLLPKDAPVVEALRAERECALVFYVFDLTDRSEIGRYRCLQLDCTADVLEDGPVYENVWWHNALFHGLVDDHVVLHFRHQRSWDTRFGALDALRP
jgi:hypothetical protein